MLYGALLGFVLAAGGVDYILALPIIVGMMGLYAGYEILVPKQFLTGGPSIYRLYKEELAKTGPLPNRPWIGYSAKLVGFGSLIGSVVFAAFRLIT